MRDRTLAVAPPTDYRLTDMTKTSKLRLTERRATQDYGLAGFGTAAAYAAVTQRG